MLHFKTPLLSCIFLPQFSLPYFFPRKMVRSWETLRDGSLSSVFLWVCFPISLSLLILTLITAFLLFSDMYLSVTLAIYRSHPLLSTVSSSLFRDSLVLPVIFSIHIIFSSFAHERYIVLIMHFSIHISSFKCPIS